MSGTKILPGKVHPQEKIMHSVEQLVDVRCCICMVWLDQLQSSFSRCCMGWLEHGQKGRAPKAVAWAINCCQSSTKTLLFHKIHTRRELFRQQSSKDQRTQEISKTSFGTLSFSFYKYFWLLKSLLWSTCNLFQMLSKEVSSPTMWELWGDTSGLVISPVRFLQRSGNWRWQYNPYIPPWLTDTHINPSWHVYCANLRDFAWGRVNDEYQNRSYRISFLSVNENCGGNLNF